MVQREEIAISMGPFHDMDCVCEHRLWHSQMGCHPERPGHKRGRLQRRLLCCGALCVRHLPPRLSCMGCLFSSYQSRSAPVRPSRVALSPGPAGTHPARRARFGQRANHESSRVGGQRAIGAAQSLLSCGAALRYVHISVWSFSSSKFSPPLVASVVWSLREPPGVFVGHLVWHRCERFEDSRYTAVRGGDSCVEWGERGVVADEDVFRVGWGNTHGRGIQTTAIEVAY